MTHIRSRHATLVAALALLAGACTFAVIEPSGEVAQETVDLDDVVELAVGGGFAMTVVADDVAEMIVRADDNVLEHVAWQIDDERVTVRLEPGVTVWGGTRELEVRLPELRELSASGGTRVDLGEDVAATDALSVSLSGGSRLQGHADVGELALDASGGARGSLSGAAETLRTQTSGGSRVDLSTLTASRCAVTASGGSRLELACDDDLDVTASGGSRIRYDGAPAVTHELSGGARLVP